MSNLSMSFWGTAATKLCWWQPVRFLYAWTKAFWRACQICSSYCVTRARL